MTISEIKSIITDSFVQNESVKSVYGLQAGKTFEEQFSKVSIENILFFAVATGIWFSYKLFEQHKTDVYQILKDNRVHTLGWYSGRAKEFQFGYNLAPETDQYDNTGFTQEQLSVARVVKFAAAMENSDQSLLYLKIANENGGKKQPITDTQLAAFKSYINRIKDAGVRIVVVNSAGDELRLSLDIYYNPLILDRHGRRLDGAADTPVQNAIRTYISNLAFNGFYANQTLVDSLQVVEGVEIAELREAASRYETIQQFIPINARSIPYAGHYQIEDKNLTINFIANE